MTDFDIEAAWTAAFTKEFKEREAKSSVPLEQWKAGGRVTRDKPHKEDGAWWFENGLEFCKALVPWLERTNWSIWEPVPGTPAVELGVSVPIGTVLYKCFIDAVFVNLAGELIVIDWKSGASDPGSALQLGGYAHAIESAFGVRPSYGAYWKARKGDNLPLVPLDKYTEKFLAAIYEPVRASIEDGRFPPHMDRHCSFCSVGHACAANDGPEAHLYDPLSPHFTGR